MGLFGKLLGREGAQKNEAAEAPKAEAAEVKGAKETGKERVDKMLEASKAAKNATMAKTGSVLARVGGAMRDAFFATIGGAEKGGKATAQYARETKTEAGQIVTSGIDAGNKLDADVAAFFQDAGTELGTKVPHTLQEMGTAIETNIEGAKRTLQAERNNLEIGAAGILENTIGSKLKQMDAFYKYVTESGTLTDEQKKAFGGTAAEVIKNVINFKRDAGRAYDDLSSQARAAQTRFEGLKNEARLGLAKAAELAGEFASIPDRVTRIETNINSQERLSAVVPETKASVKREDVDQEAETLPKTVAK